MIDRVADFDGPLNLQIIYLHGQASKPEHGFIFSEAEYSKAVVSERFHWYDRAGQDYLLSPIFIGSRLDEPVFWAQVERAKRIEASLTSLGFVFTNSAISEIQSESLKAKGLLHVKASLEEFSGWLLTKFPNGITPSDVVKLSSYEGIESTKITSYDINAAHYLHPIILSKIVEGLASKPPREIDRLGRQFFRGFQPSWDIAASEIPVQLKECSVLYDKMQEALKNNSPLFVLVGQAGSGKTTAIMMTLLKYLQSGTRKLYEVTSDVRSIRNILIVLKKLDQPCIVYIGDLFLYGDHLADDLEQLKGTEIMVVTSARLGEWNEHFSRYLGRVAVLHQFSRFSEQDYDPLLNRLNKYVAAPFFMKLVANEKRRRLANSRRQLLIALHETTHSEKFSEVIANEFTGLPDDDTRRLFVIVGLATSARVGISVETAASIYQKKSKRSFAAALSALEGIVDKNSAGRLFARHEIYVREIIEHVIDFNSFSEALCDILSVFARYEIPVIKKINRTDGYLFKTLINHDFIYRAGSIYGDATAGVSIYERFEIDFQLDGHFWLQYGLYLNNIGKPAEALTMLKQSVEAYPDNPFALHALSQLKLRIASSRKVYDKTTENLIQEAIATLEALNSRSTPGDDTYPLVTLSMGHVGALVAHNKYIEAKNYARTYHRRLQAMGRRTASDAVAQAEHAMLRYVTLGEAPTKLYGPATPRFRPR